MKVDYDKNLWIDYGAGEGGTLIDLVMRMEWCDAGTAMRLLEQQIGGATTFSFQEDCPALPERTPSIIVEDVLPLEIPALLFYLMERGIDLDTARLHCSEVHYRVADKSYFAVGFRNDTGGWELRNRYFKGCIAPKEISHTRQSGKARNTCYVFEGFMDYLSFLTLRQESCPNYPELDGQDYIVLNSVSNVNKALYPLGSYERIHCFFDNDHAGIEALQQIRKEYSRDRYIRDASQIYSGCKDLNEYLQKQVERKRQVQSVKGVSSQSPKKKNGFRL